MEDDNLEEAAQIIADVRRSAFEAGYQTGFNIGLETGKEYQELVEWCDNKREQGNLIIKNNAEICRLLDTMKQLKKELTNCPHSTSNG